MIDEAAIEAGRILFAGSCEFAAGTETEERIPPATLPEIAFAGRSNVGKSSLINALTGRKTLARVSHTPGRTQQINFFDLAHRLFLVDLPGYGYAAVSKTQSHNWGQLIQSYLKGRVSLRLVCVLIDSRHGIKDTDAAILKLLDKSAVPYRVILTKTDEIKKAELQEVTEATEKSLKKHTAAFPHTVATSSRESTGIPELRAVLAEIGI